MRSDLELVKFRLDGSTYNNGIWPRCQEVVLKQTNAQHGWKGVLRVTPFFTFSPSVMVRHSVSVPRIRGQVLVSLVPYRTFRAGGCLIAPLVHESR